MPYRDDEHDPEYPNRPVIAVEEIISSNPESDGSSQYSFDDITKRTVIADYITVGSISAGNITIIDPTVPVTIADDPDYLDVRVRESELGGVRKRS